jgi:CubicO group peptidase (beta-lactamase class C family)
MRQAFLVLFVMGVSLFMFTKSSHSAPPSKTASAVGSLPMAKPEEVGFSSERLQRIHDAMQRHIDAGEIAGVVTLVAKNGRIVYFEPQGWADVDTKRPMQKDSVFNWASATKPMTATAILMLVEEGKIHPDDPVSKFIPEFKDAKVRILKPGATLEAPAFQPGSAIPLAPSNESPLASSELVRADHDITIRDLLTHTSGLMSLGVPNPAAPPADDLLSTTLAGMMPRFAAVPLDFQPATKWAYSNWAGFDILARIVEIASGNTFDQFLKERLFEPLGIRDAGFDPFDDNRASRVAIRYGVVKGGGIKKPDLPTPWSRAKNYYSGAAGLSGTTEDYWRFMQMLANGGEFNGKRILSPGVVELMSSNHVGDLFPGAQGFVKAGTGFGYGVQVVVNRVVGDQLLPNGTFGWVGASGCEGLANTKENIVLVFMVGGGANATARVDFHNMAMQAFVQ